MLSYRHAFHAGNHADVLKHLVEVLALRYLAAKEDRPLRYIDTHAGPGRFDLQVWCSPDHFGGNGSGTYVRGGFQIPLSQFLGGGSPKGCVEFHVGRSMVEDNENYGIPDYMDWGATVSIEREDVTLRAQYLDNDLDGLDLGDAFDSRFVVTMIFGLF